MRCGSRRRGPTHSVCRLVGLDGHAAAPALATHAFLRETAGSRVRAAVLLVPVTDPLVDPPYDALDRLRVHAIYEGATGALALCVGTDEYAVIVAFTARSAPHDALHLEVRFAKPGFALWIVAMFGYAD